ncbi:hypothetical protein BS50DRAFT_622037 [Corynespora cassiicola Philippines]|uniref:Uncharacterized protein n=1 Tax=Corynespora cassiicola Philippines TaxID=1448308 RepID=A0A2T2NM54_CORCC|nr:hypothetical protein BS50DRAFT_622037 [Corynespora cassiicola Philippines]
MLEAIIPRLLRCFRTPFCHQNLSQEAVEDMETDYVPGFSSLVEDMMKKITQFIKPLKPAHGSLATTPGFTKSYWDDKALWYGTIIDSVYVSSKYPGMWLIQCSEEPSDSRVLRWNSGLNHWYCEDYGFAIWFEEVPNEAGQGGKTAEIWVEKIFIENGKRINKMVRVEKKPKAGTHLEWKVKYGGAIAYQDAAPKLPIQYDPLEGPGWRIAYDEAKQRENTVQDEDYVMVEKEPEDERLLEYLDELLQEEATTESGLQWVSNAIKRRKTKKSRVPRHLTKENEEICELLSGTVQEVDIVSKKKAKQDAKIQPQQLEWEETRWHAERDQQNLKGNSTEGEVQPDRTDDSAHAQGKDAWKEAMRGDIPLRYVRIDGELYEVRRRTSAERMAYQEHLDSLAKSSREHNS